MITTETEFSFYRKQQNLELANYEETKEIQPES